MKLLVLVFVLIQINYKVESKATHLDNLISVMGAFVKVLRNTFKTAGIEFERIYKNIFPNQDVVKEISVTTDSSTILFDPQNLDYSRESYFVTLPTEPSFQTTDLLIQSHGRRCSTHIIYTEDGYELILHRLINPTALRGIKQTVLLHHGLLGSSADWILLGPDKSLPYYLATLGYDVWLANARGNRYSHKHKKNETQSNSSKYWDFSWQEMGLYDLPAIIDHVRNKTKEPLNFIGHSMGATALLVLLSSVPQYNECLRMAILLGPIAYMKNIKGPLGMIISLLPRAPTDDVLKILGRSEFIPSRKLPKDWMKRFCLDEALFCSNPLFFLSGVPRNHTQWNHNFTKSLFEHVPAGGSTKTFLHYVQLVKSGKFHRFGDITAEFPLKEVTTPIALISSSDDWLATIPDLVRLYINIFNPLEHYIIRDRNVSHTDFVWGQTANRLVFPKVIELLQGTSPAVAKYEYEV